MPKGAKPKPRESKVLTGTFRKDREPESVPEYDAADIKAPAYLEGLAFAKWNELAPLLAGQKVLQKTDRASLEAYCVAYANFREAQSEVDREGFKIPGSMGGLVKNPSATVVKESLAEMRAYSQLLGLDPSSRGRIHGGKKEKARNPFTDL